MAMTEDKKKGSGVRKRSELPNVKISMPEDMDEEVRDTVDALDRLLPERLTMSEFFRDAIHRHLVYLRKKHNKGERFAKRPAAAGRRP
jgi:metal-responsive CopG/Arc/MetJ family transcriptional regulator